MKGVLIAFVCAILPTLAEESHSVTGSLSSSALSGFVDTSISSNERPANDDFENAILFSGLTNLVTASNAGATIQAGEDAVGVTRSTWYRWTVPVSGRAQVSLRPVAPSIESQAVVVAPSLSEEGIFFPGGGIDPTPIGVIETTSGGPGEIIFGLHLTVYSGTALGNLTAIGSGQYLEFDAQAGTTYSIAFQTESGSFDFTGPHALYASVTPPPANDRIDNAIVVEHASAVNFWGSLLAASRDAHEPDLGADFSGASVWFGWNADTFGAATLSVTHPAAVFRGGGLAEFSVVAKSASGNISFFAEEGVTYWIAVYKGVSTTNEFSGELRGPKYRLYETTMAELFPTGFVPRFHGLRGVTAILYENTTDGWERVEIERIIDQATIMTNRPTVALDGKLRVTTIDDAMPSPRVELTVGAGADAGAPGPTLRGYAGQSGFISYSKDLVNWTPYTPFTLTSGSMDLDAKNAAGDATFFYRVTQSMPDNLLPTTTLTPPQ